MGGHDHIDLSFVKLSSWTWLVMDMTMWITVFFLHSNSSSPSIISQKSSEFSIIFFLIIKLEWLLPFILLSSFGKNIWELFRCFWSWYFLFIFKLYDKGEFFKLNWTSLLWEFIPLCMKSLNPFFFLKIKKWSLI